MTMQVPTTMAIQFKQLRTNVDGPSATPRPSWACRRKPSRATTRAGGDSIDCARCDDLVRASGLPAQARSLLDYQRVFPGSPQKLLLRPHLARTLLLVGRGEEPLPALAGTPRRAVLPLLRRREGIPAGRVPKAARGAQARHGAARGALRPRRRQQHENQLDARPSSARARGRTAIRKPTSNVT